MSLSNRQMSDDQAAMELRARYDRNHAAGRAIDDDGDEHGCPLRAPGCRYAVAPSEEPITASEIAADYIAFPERWPLARIEALPAEVRAAIRTAVLELREGNHGLSNESQPRPSPLLESPTLTAQDVGA